MVRLRTDVWLAVGVGLVACLAAAVLPTSLAVLRAPLALPLVLFVPGYAIVVATLRPDDRSTAEVVALAIAASIGTAIVSGVLLNAVQVRLLATPWMAFLLVVTVAAAAVATARGHAREVSVPRVALRRLDAAALALALALLGAAAALGLAPGAVVGDIDALFALGVGADEGAVDVDDSLVKEVDRLLGRERLRVRLMASMRSRTSHRRNRRQKSPVVVGSGIALHPGR